MINWLKWRLARKEMEELERWRVYWFEARQWLGEFPDAADALDRLHDKVKGRGDSYFNLPALRARMRERRSVEGKS